MSVVQIDHAHYHIHAGVNFTASKTLLAVANAGNLDLRLTTGALSCHILVYLTSTGKSTYAIYEAPTISAGTAVTTYNSNRNIATASTALVKHTPTVTATGSTAIIDGLMNGGTGGVASGAMGGSRQEIILKPSTEYLIRLTNTAGTAQDLNVVLSWYEVS